jgi:hypothetical protein
MSCQKEVVSPLPRKTLVETLKTAMSESLQGSSEPTQGQHDPCQASRVVLG